MCGHNKNAQHGAMARAIVTRLKPTGFPRFHLEFMHRGGRQRERRRKIRTFFGSIFEWQKGK